MKYVSYSEMSKPKYLFYILFHPQIGFEEMKFNRKGSVLLANIVLVLFYLLTVVNRVGTGFLFETQDPEDVNVLWILAGTVGLVIVWTISNWMFCTLLDGKAYLSEIWITTCYSLLPYVILSLPMTVISHCLSSEESVFYTTAMALIYCWVGILLFVGLMSMHQFSISKNICTILFTLFGIAVIIFVFVLIFTLYRNVYIFFVNIFGELSFRIR